MAGLKSARGRASTLGELFRFFWQRKLWWMIPLLSLMLLVMILVMLAQAGAVAPWMYPL